MWPSSRYQECFIYLFHVQLLPAGHQAPTTAALKQPRSLNEQNLQSSSWLRSVRVRSSWRDPGVSAESSCTDVHQRAPQNIPPHPSQTSSSPQIRKHWTRFVFNLYFWFFFFLCIECSRIAPWAGGRRGAVVGNTVDEEKTTCFIKLWMHLTPGKKGMCSVRLMKPIKTHTNTRTRTAKTLLPVYWGFILTSGSSACLRSVTFRNLRWKRDLFIRLYSFYYYYYYFPSSPNPVWPRFNKFLCTSPSLILCVCHVLLTVSLPDARNSPAASPRARHSSNI